MSQIWFYTMNSILMLILVMIMTLLSTAFLTLYERKIMGLFHYRKGPNKVSFIGILQPFSDALKLIFKEYFYPMKVNFIMYLISPMLMFMLIMLMWLIYPFFSNLIQFNFSFIFFLSMMSMGVYGLIFSGWSSNSLFSMIGSIRSLAQSISYEVSFSLSVMTLLMINNSMNLFMTIQYKKNILYLMLTTPILMIMLISILAEINRTPFDLSEGESELVSGFNVEYSSSKFVLIFLSEYASILFMMYLLMYLFMLNFFSLLNYVILIMLILLITWIRMTFPRIRYDILMMFCWKFLLSITLIMFMYMLINYKFFMDLMNI
uniref:NADH-ubiquinone oxidoreductase chain 1 n=1 Tax=Mirax sp. QL-2014 TaxID=1491721 RepID=A0A0U1WEK3_9HYME|nr:NADH dehydrogenase subunit 1 [Mirax sp. QL-2014]